MDGLRTPNIPFVVNLRGEPKRLQRIVAASLALIVAGCIIEAPRGVDVFSVRDTISVDATPGLAQEPVERSVVLHVPAGALEGVERAVFDIDAMTGSAEPFPGVEFAIGDPVNETLLVDSAGQFDGEYDMPVPTGCSTGCDFVIPVVITQMTGGETPRVTWSVAFYFFGGGPWEPSPAADNMTVEIIPADN